MNESIMKKQKKEEAERVFHFLLLGLVGSLARPLASSIKNKMILFFNYGMIGYGLEASLANKQTQH